MRRITSRFVLLIATAAVLPLVVYGYVSVSSLRSGTEASVRDGNLKVAKQVAEQVSMYMRNNTRVLQSVGTELGATGLAPWQQDGSSRTTSSRSANSARSRCSISAGAPLATSALGDDPPERSRTQRGTEPDRPYIAPLKVDDDSLPTTTIAVRLTRSQQDAGWIVGEISLEELWRMVDEIHVGNERLCADRRRGRPADRARQPRRKAAHRRRRSERAPAPKCSSRPAFRRRQHLRSHRVRRERHGRCWRSAAAVGEPAAAGRSSSSSPSSRRWRRRAASKRQLLAAIFLALLGTIVLGYLWGRTFIQRIFALTRVTRSIAEGKLDTRVEIGGKDEIHELGDAFNSMADRLVELQEDIRKQERQVMFGRIAAGLVHDLSHPIMNIGNGCKLIVKMWDDADYRETFRRMFERELQLVKRVLEDLQNIAKPIPLERFPVELNRSVGETIESMQALAETAGITLQSQLSTEELYVEGDVFALGRVYRNLVVNAIQATAPGGLVVAAVEGHGDRVQIRVVDTGCGIPADRLQAVFEDFVTTKRRGLGLGLAITRKIVEQLGGRISVASEVGKGTTFVIDFPRTSARPMAQAAG